MKKLLLPVAALFLVGACVSVNKSVLMDRSQYPVAESRVYVFLPQDSVSPDCQRVALLNASGAEGLTNESQMIDRLREEAGKLGANAILMQSMEDPGGAERFASAIFGTQSDRDGSAIALWCPDRARLGTQAPDTSGLIR